MVFLFGSPRSYVVDYTKETAQPTVVLSACDWKIMKVEICKQCKNNFELEKEVKFFDQRHEISLM